jgi:hypothetical protein
MRTLSATKLITIAEIELWTYDKTFVDAQLEKLDEKVARELIPAVERIIGPLCCSLNVQFLSAAYATVVDFSVTRKFRSLKGRICSMLFCLTK